MATIRQTAGVLLSGAKANPGKPQVATRGHHSADDVAAAVKELAADEGIEDVDVRVGRSRDGYWFVEVVVPKK